MEDNRYELKRKMFGLGTRKSFPPMKSVKPWRRLPRQVVQTEAGDFQEVTGRLVWPGGWPCFEQWHPKAVPTWTIPHSCDCLLCLQAGDVIRLPPGAQPWFLTKTNPAPGCPAMLAHTQHTLSASMIPDATRIPSKTWWYWVPCSDLCYTRI